MGFCERLTAEQFANFPSDVQVGAKDVYYNKVLGELCRIGLDDDLNNMITGFRGRFTATATEFCELPVRGPGW